MLEGTFEELLDAKEDDADQQKVAGNETMTERVKRQAEIPPEPEQDNTKYMKTSANIQLKGCDL